jgi:RNA recognition motif-containing protein
MESQNRIFVGGIPVRVEKKAIVDFFGQFGKIRHCKIKKNSKTGRSLGYAYITFEDVQSTKLILNTQVEFCGRICECKPVFKKEELKEEICREKKRKLLIYEIDPATTNTELRDLFGSLTSISHAYVVKDPDSDLNVGYGYVVFNSESLLNEFCSKKLPLCLNGKQVKYTNRFHVPPKKKSKQSKNPASNFEDEQAEGMLSQRSNSQSKDPQESEKSSHLSNRIQTSDKGQYLNAVSSENRPMKKNAILLPASIVQGVRSSQASGSKIFPKPSRLHTDANQTGNKISDELRAPNQGQFLNSVANIHTTFAKLQPERDQTGFTESTKESRVIQQMPSKFGAKKSHKYKLTTTMRDILRTSLYLSQKRDNYRFNRSSGQLY